MKLLFSVLLLCVGFGPLTAKAQDEVEINLKSIESVDDKIEITFESNKKFIIGNNRYILHVGGNYFKYSKHPEGDESRLTFLLSPEEFEALADGASMQLVYGLYHKNTLIDEGGDDHKFDGPNWSAGNLNKQLLKK